PFPPGLHARLLPNGNLLFAGRSGKVDPPDRPGVGKYPMGGAAGWLIEMDWNGKILFQYRDPSMHHDFHPMPNGNYIYVAWDKVPKDLQNKVRGGYKGSEHHSDGSMFADKLVEVNPRGEVVWEWRAIDHFDVNVDIIGPVHPREEWSHFNNVDVMENGNILTDGRHLDSMMIIDKKTGNIIWRWGSVAYLDEGGTIEFCRGINTMGGQHDCNEIPTGYPGAGNIICYDNGMYVDESRAVEVDPKTNKVVWESKQHGKYARLGGIGRKHFSNFISGAERLPNGNTLITDGANGRIFEVTPQQEVVWEYVSGYFTAPTYQGAMFRSHRYAVDYVPQFKNLKPARGPAVVPPDVSKFRVAPQAEKAKEEGKEKEEELAPRIPRY
ncbi:MAG: aryl-sulfate sulfotransferase, partial [Candidatus Tectomicrobia bacterium]|nr:aryl-sulfate sulfotransferase [Candidatus Tectomicrobia bacterium]